MGIADPVEFVLSCCLQLWLPVRLAMFLAFCDMNELPHKRWGKVANLPGQGISPSTRTCTLPLVVNCCAHPKRCWPVQDSASLLRVMSGLQQACDEPKEDGSDAEAVAASQLLASMAARGAVVERPVPDFDAHGVGVALHVFPGLMPSN